MLRTFENIKLLEGDPHPAAMIRFVAGRESTEQKGE